MFAGKRAESEGNYRFVLRNEERANHTQLSGRSEVLLDDVRGCKGKQADKERPASDSSEAEYGNKE
jgi:hypothetical protein